MKSLIFLSLILLSLVFAIDTTTGTQHKKGRCAKPLLNAVTFNTYGVNSGLYLFERIGTFSQYFPQFMKENDIEVACLQELWDPEIRNFALAGFNATQVYHPDPLPQPGCQNACLNVSLDPNTPIINQWLLGCAFTVIPSIGKSCADFEGSLEFQQCILQVCPTIVPYLLDKNPTCVFCSTTPVAGESTKDRILKCASQFDPSDAAKCKWAFGGQADGTIVSKLPILERGYFPFPDAINPMSNRGITYAKVKTKSGINVKVFCTHLITSPDGVPPNFFVDANAAQVKSSIDYVNSKVKPGDIFVFMGDTNNGLSGKTWNPIWPENYQLYSNVWKDASAPNGFCTYGCNMLDISPEAPRDIDHIFVSKKSLIPLVFNNTRVVLDKNIVQTTKGPVPLSDHFGLATTLCIGI